MATSGNDETELDSESVIDPDSLSHCSDIYAPSYEEAQNIRFKESFYLQAQLVAASTHHVQFEGRLLHLYTAAFVQATFLFRMVGLTTSNGMYQDPFTSKDRRTCVVLATFFQRPKLVLVKGT